MTLGRALAGTVGRLMRRRSPRPAPPDGKYGAEVRFWHRQLGELVDWYEGRLAVHFRTPAPAPAERVDAGDPRRSAIATWLERHQKPKYLADLRLRPEAFDGLRLLDVGCGPMPSAEAFTGCRELLCLDPLIPRYLAAGYPLARRPTTRFVCGFAEAMPLADGSVDAVISMNALDHVDDFDRTAAEIGRVLRPGGAVRIHLHYHPPTRTEPLALDDQTVARAFAWCPGFRKLASVTEQTSASAGPGESYNLWSSFDGDRL